MTRATPLLLLLAGNACVNDPPPPPSTCAAIEAAIADSPVMKPELAFAARDPASGRVEVGTFETSVDVVAGAASNDETTIAVGPEGAPGLQYRVREPNEALAAAVCGPIPGGAGGVPTIS